MKKLLTFLITLIMILMPITSYAQNNTTEGIAPFGVLRDQDGNEYFVKGYLVESPTAFSIGSDPSVQSQTYGYDISLRAGSGQQTEDDYDDSLSYRVYLTINWLNRPYTENNSEYLLTKVSGRWVQQDTDVSCSGGSLSYGCTSGTIVQVKYDRAVSNNFSINTGFTKYVDDIWANMGASLTIELERGSEIWEFTLSNNRLGSSPV